MEYGLTAGGWIFLIAAWGAITALTVFCFGRVLRNHRQKKP